MLKIGLTGGIGSGKTTVSEHFERLGAPVIDTDVLAREVVEPGQPALKKLIEAFGPGILQDDGSLDRDRLREIAFATPAARQQMESIVHPSIRERLQRRLDNMDHANVAYCVIVVPLLVETNFHEMVDRILVVEAPREPRIERVMARNGMTRAEVEQIMESQSTSEERLRVAHDVLYNDASVDELKVSVERLHAKYLVVPERVK